MRTVAGLSHHILVAGFLLLVPAGIANAQVRIVQTNSGGDNIHLIDPSTNTIVERSRGSGQPWCGGGARWETLLLQQRS